MGKKGQGNERIRSREGVCGLRTGAPGKSLEGGIYGNGLSKLVISCVVESGWESELSDPRREAVATERGNIKEV